jgi:hypothetical protein
MRVSAEFCVHVKSSGRLSTTEKDHLAMQVFSDDPLVDLMTHPRCRCDTSRPSLNFSKYIDVANSGEGKNDQVIFELWGSF